MKHFDLHTEIEDTLKESTKMASDISQVLGRLDGYRRRVFIYIIFSIVAFYFFVVYGHNNFPTEWTSISVVISLMFFSLFSYIFYSATFQLAQISECRDDEIKAFKSIERIVNKFLNSLQRDVSEYVITSEKHRMQRKELESIIQINTQYINQFAKIVKLGIGSKNKRNTSVEELLQLKEFAGEITSGYSQILAKINELQTIEIEQSQRTNPFQQNLIQIMEKFNQLKIKRLNNVRIFDKMPF